MIYIEDLKSAYKAKRIIDQTEKRIEKLKESKEKATSEQRIKSISEEIEMLELKVATMYGNIHDTVQFIDDCDDVIISEAMYHRFLLGKDWDGVACAMGGYNSSAGIRMMVSRYLKKKGVTRRAGEE